MRLGPRLTARQTEDKSTEKSDDRPANTDDGAAEGGAAGPNGTDGAGGEPIGGEAAEAGEADLTAGKNAAADTPEPDTADPDVADPDTTPAADDTAEPDTADPGVADQNTTPAADDTAELDQADVAAATPADGDTAELDKGDVAAAESADGDAAVLRGGHVVPDTPATDDTIELGKEGQTVTMPSPGKKTTRLGWGIAAVGLGARTLHQWGIRVARLWQPGPGIREAADPGGRTFAMVTALPSLLLIAWLLPGIVLLLARRFLPAPMVLISVPVAVALTMLAARQIPGRWPTLDTKRRDKPTKSKSWAAWWGLGGTVVIAAAFAAWQLMENSPQFIVSRDPGASAQIAFWIADHGALPIPASLAAFGGAHPGLAFSSFGFTSHGASVVPGLASGLPIVLAAGMWVHGVTGATMMSPLLGALAVLAVGGLTGRLAGPQWAPAGAFLLALTIPEVYTSRSAFSETLAQALLFGGLCLVIDSFSSRRPLTLAILGGLSLGLTVLAGTGLLLVLLPAIPVLGALLAGRKPQAIPLAAGLAAGVICGLAAGIGLDYPALTTTAPSFSMIGILAAGFTAVTAVGVTVGLVGPARRRARKLLDGRPLRWLPDAAAVLVLAAVIGLAVRPYLQKVRGPASPYVAALQRLESLPVDPGRLYAENSLYWVIWYLGVPALLLGVVGLAMVTRQCLRALITWRDDGGAARAWALPVAIIGWGLFAVLWQPNTVPDQPWASRRLVPVILPGLVVLAVWVASWLIGRAHARGAGLTAVALATACFVVALAEPPAAITFGIELSHPANPATRTALSGLAFRRTGAGQIIAVERLCGAIPRNSSVLLLDKVAARAFAQVIRGTCDVPAGVVSSSAPGAASAILGGIERSGHHPVLLASRASELVPYGAPSNEIVNLATQQDAQLLTRPPTSTWPVRYVLWMSAPGGAVIGS